MPAFDAAFLNLTILDIVGRPIESIPDGGGVAYIDEFRMNPAATSSGAILNAAKPGIKYAATACINEKGHFIVDFNRRMGID